MIELVLHGVIVPKARARVTRNGTFHPHRYQQWKKAAIATLKDLVPSEPNLSGVHVEIILQGKHPRRGDLDNLAGSCLDALVQSDILKDDNLNNVTGLAIWLEYDKNKEPISLIRIGTDENTR